LNQLRKQYLKNDDICNCNSLLDIHDSYKYLKEFPKAVSVIDSIEHASAATQNIIFYEDSLMKKKLLYGSTIFIDIYFKRTHVTQSYGYENKHCIFHNSSFEPSSIGTQIEYDTLGNTTEITYQNYLKYYETEKEGRKIKRKYPICWREAYLLAKKFAGIKDDKEKYRLTRDVYVKHPKWWFVAFGNSYEDIYIVNAKNGKVKE
jgi:hypothetical protein